MTIRRLLHIAVAVAIGAVLCLAAVSWFLSARLAQISAAEELAQATTHDISDLLVVTHEYALYSEERAAQQWRTLHGAILAKTERAAAGPIPLPVGALSEARALPDAFEALVSATASRSDLQKRQRDVILSQLLANIQVLSDSVHRWSTVVSAYDGKLQRGYTWLLVIIPFLMLLILVLFASLILRRVLNPLSVLHKAVQAVSRGDLTVRCATNTDDEFGQLSRTFDAMAIDLVSELRQEISERRRAEEALQESEFFFRESQIAANIGSYKADFRSGTWTSSEVLDGIFGIDEGYDRSIEGWLQVIHPEDRAAMSRYLEEEVLGKRKRFSHEYRIVRISDGETRWVTGLGGLRIGDDGSLALMGTIHDITDRKVLERERTVLHEQLLKSKKLESLGVLAGGIAHDFNNILMVILGNAEMTRMQLPPGSAAAPHLQRIEQAANRAADLARQMLAYSGKGSFVIEELDLNRVLTETAPTLESTIPSNVMLRLQLGPGLPLIAADVRQLRQLLANLVTNASEAIGGNPGEIVVSTGVKECRRNYLKDVWLDEEIAEGLYVHLEVADTGCGMDGDTVAKVFDPFFTTKFTGRGLGLAAVLGIVRGHGGAIKIESEPGKGSVFRVLLPALEKAVQPVATDAQSPRRAMGKVLLVDDEEQVRQISCGMLRELGFEVLTANDGVEALEQFGRHDDVAFVILDLTMPRMDGEECLRRLKKLRPDVKVLLSSGFNEQEIADRFAGKGLAGFLQKPYRIGSLQETIGKLLGTPR